MFEGEQLPHERPVAPSNSLNHRARAAANICLMQIRTNPPLAALFARLGANTFNVLVCRYLFSCCETHLHKGRDREMEGEGQSGRGTEWERAGRSWNGLHTSRNLKYVSIRLIIWSGQQEKGKKISWILPFYALNRLNFTSWPFFTGGIKLRLFVCVAFRGLKAPERPRFYRGKNSKSKQFFLNIICCYNFHF